MVLRKRKRAKLTQTALDGLKREATAAGWSLEQVIRECCERGWLGFKAEWVAHKVGIAGATETTYQRSMRERVEQVAPGIAANAHGARNHQQPEAIDVIAQIVD